MAFPTDRLYKFASFNENSLSALAEQTVWFSDLDSLNDPFEVSVRYEIPKNKDDKIIQCIKAGAIDREKELNISPEEAFDYVEKIYKQDPVVFLNKFDEGIEFVKNEHTNLLNSLNIFSTSLDVHEDTFHSENMLMWSHYGVGFTGFCLQFSASEFLQSIIELNTESKIGFCKVEYVRETQVVNPIKYVPQPDESYFDASTSAGDTLQFSYSVSRIRTAFNSNVVLRSCSITTSNWASNSFGFQATSSRTNAKNPLGLLKGNSKSVVSISL